MMAKYHNRKTTVNGVTFDSAAEARRYGELRLLERAGVIEGLKLQPKYELQPKFKRGKRTIRAITYAADFAYTEDGKTVAEDVKGVKTEAFKLKAKLFEFRYPEIELRVVGA